MAVYYINKFNTGGGIYPYSRPEDGAENFYELVKNPNTKVQLQHGDQIRLYNPCPGSTCVVDDSSYDIEFYKEVRIVSDSPNNGIIVKLKSDGQGLKFYRGASKSTIRDVTFTKSNFNGGSLIYAEDVISLYIATCRFVVFTVSSDGIAINLNQCQHAHIYNNYVEIPTSTLGYGIKLENCQQCNVEFNGVNLKDVAGYGISCDANVESFGNYIGGNVIYNMGENSVAINMYGQFNIEDIQFNVMKLAGANSYGVVLSIPVGYGREMAVKNNVFIFEEDTSALFGIYIPDFGVNSAADYSIVNNVFYNPSADSLDYDIQFALAMSINIGVDGEVDYNLFYGFDSNNIYYWGGNPDTLSAMGSRTYTDLDPQMLIYYDEAPSLPYEVSAVHSYISSASSQVLGAGKDHQHIGIYQVNNYGFQYANFIDTVTHEMGSVRFESTGAWFTFFNCTFTESIEKVNLNHRKFYTSGDNYQNQFSWESSAAEDFPFTNQNHLYDENLLYVIQNKDSLEPFDGIFCPANPGYNFSAYPGYETGIFGFSRADYINTCIAEACIIQDDIDSDFIWLDEINASYVIQDSINPPCADDAPVSSPMEY